MRELRILPKEIQNMIARVVSSEGGFTKQRATRLPFDDAGILEEPFDASLKHGGIAKPLFRLVRDNAEDRTAQVLEEENFKKTLTSMLYEYYRVLWQ